MKWNALAEQSSSLCKALSVIGDRWTLLILNQCFLKLRRYGEIQSSLGLSKPLLAARLKKMDRLGMLKKVPSRKSARVHEYLLTEKGRQLYPASCWPLCNGEMPWPRRRPILRSTSTFHARTLRSDNRASGERSATGPSEQRRRCCACSFGREPERAPIPEGEVTMDETDLVSARIRNSEGDDQLDLPLTMQSHWVDNEAATPVRHWRAGI